MDGRLVCWMDGWSVGLLDGWMVGSLTTHSIHFNGYNGIGHIVAK